MRILFLSFYYPPHIAASGRIVQEMADWLRRKHLVILLSMNLPVKWLRGQETGITHVQRVPRIPLPAVVAAILVLPLFVYWSIRKGRDADVIVAQHHSFHFTAAAAVFAGKLLRKPVVVRSEDVMRPMGIGTSIVLEGVGYLSELLGTRANLFTVVCSEQRNSLLDRVRVPPERIRIHPNFAPRPANESSQADPRRETTPTIVFVGRITKEYGLGVLLRAMPDVISSYPGTQLVLIGDGPELPYLRALTVSLEIEKNVLFAGVCNQSQVSEWLERATVGIGPLMPTRTLPRKVIEYSFASVPMLVGKNSVTSDFACSGENCLEISPIPSKIAEGLTKMIGDSQFRAKIGFNARERASAFDLERACVAFENLLTEARAIASVTSW